jgi:DNA-directed RNA polymerase specialized sigma24 family protein
LASFEAQDLRMRELARSNGRDEAFAILSATHGDKLHRLCLAFFKDPMQAEDALQESFILIWRNLAQHDGRAPLLHWASAITRDCCRKGYRRLVQMREVEMKDVNVRPDDDSQTDSKLQCGAVRHFVNRLPERYRLVVLLSTTTIRRCRKSRNCLEFAQALFNHAYSGPAVPYLSNSVFMASTDWNLGWRRVHEKRLFNAQEWFD